MTKFKRAAACLIASLTCSSADGAVITFDSLNASAGPVDPIMIARYLSQFGIPHFSGSIGSWPVVVDAMRTWTGGEVWSPSRYNILTMYSGGAPSGLILPFTTDLSAIQFTRASFAGFSQDPTVHPQWSLEAFDRQGRSIGYVYEGFTETWGSVPAQVFRIEAPGIARVIFRSDPMGYATFDAVLIDDIITTPIPSPGAILLLAVAPLAARHRRARR